MPYNTFTRHRDYRLFYFSFNILEALLVLRFIFRSLGTGPSSLFIDTLYRTAAPFIAPFRGLFSPMPDSGRVWDWPTLAAMIFYALAVPAFIKLVDLAFSPA